MALTPYQCRAARGLLGLTQKALAELARVDAVTLNFFESERRNTHHRTVKAIEEALVKAGAVFLPAGEGMGPGLRLAKNPKATKKAK